VTDFQYKELGGTPHEAAGELMTRVQETVMQAADRFNQTADLHRNKAVTLETALESLREIQEHAAWATRMLIELTGAYRQENGKGRTTLSMRAMAQASGVSLASVHQWVNHPAEVIDGRAGPGTLPKPGQTNHFHGKITDGSAAPPTPGTPGTADDDRFDLDDLL
jgi:phage gpG-like protein